MDSMLTTLGFLFFMFFLISACVEAVLEAFRGVLSTVGITALEGKYTVDDAMKLAREFAPNPESIEPKIAAIKKAAEQIEGLSVKNESILKRIEQGVKTSTEEEKSGMLAELSEVAADLRNEIDTSETKRILILRFLSAALGCLIVWQADFYVFRLIDAASGSDSWLHNIGALRLIWVNILVGGISAAAGSSYWHDQLDRIRNIKGVEQQIVALRK